MRYTSFASLFAILWLFACGNANVSRKTQESQAGQRIKSELPNGDGYEDGAMGEQEENDYDIEDYYDRDDRDDEDGSDSEGFGVENDDEELEKKIEELERRLAEKEAEEKEREEEENKKEEEANKIPSNEQILAAIAKKTWRSDEYGSLRLNISGNSVTSNYSYDGHEGQLKGNAVVKFPRVAIQGQWVEVGESCFLFFCSPKEYTGEFVFAFEVDQKAQNARVIESKYSEEGET